MINEEKILEGIVAFLKARVTALGTDLTVIGKGDPLPQTGARLFVDVRIEPDVDSLFYAYTDIFLEAPALQENAESNIDTAVGFVTEALPRDQSQRVALSTAVETATGNQVKVNFYHHEPGGAAAGDGKTYVREKNVKVAMEEV